MRIFAAFLSSLVCGACTTAALWVVTSVWLPGAVPLPILALMGAWVAAAILVIHARTAWDWLTILTAPLTAAVLLGAAWHASGAALPGMPQLPLWPFAAIAALVILAMGLRWLAIVCILRARVRLLLLSPANGWEPDADAVEHLGRRLAAVRFRAFAWLVSPACAITFGLISAGDNRCAMTVELPKALEERFRTIVHSALIGVSIRPVDVLPDSPTGRARVRTELRLGMADHLSLASLPHSPDPLHAFAAIYARARKGESISVKLSLLPLGPLARMRHGRQALRAVERKALSQELHPQLSVLEGRTDLALGRNKLAEGRSALFRLQILCETTAADGARAHALTAQLLTVWARFGAANYLRPLRTLPGLGWWFDVRAHSGLFFPRGRNLVTLPEVAVFMRPPASGSVHVLRTDHLSSPARSIVPYEAPWDMIPLGGLVSQDELPVGFRPDTQTELTTALVLGMSGSGKSSIMVGQALHFMKRARTSVVMVDPHRVSAMRVLAGLDPHEREQVELIDLEGGVRIPALNIFDVAGRDANAVEDAVLPTRDALFVMTDAPLNANRVRSVIKRAAEAFLTINSTLLPDDQLTVFQLDRWFSDSEWRDMLTPRLPERQQRYWAPKGGFKDEQASAGPLIALIEGMRSSRSLRALLGRSRSSLDMSALLSGERSLLCCPGDGFEGHIVANVIAFQVVSAVRSRSQMSERSYRPAALMIDEAPLVERALRIHLGQAVRELRKFKTSVWLYSQEASKLSAQTLSSVLSNRILLMSASIADEDARKLSANLGKLVSVPELVSLPKHRFFVQARRDAPFQLCSLPPERLFGPALPLHLVPDDIPVPDPEELEVRMEQLCGSNGTVERPCKGCGRPIPPTRRADAEYCTEQCRVRYGRLRRLEVMNGSK